MLKSKEGRTGFDIQPVIGRRCYFSMVYCRRITNANSAAKIKKEVDIDDVLSSPVAQVSHSISSMVTVL